MTKMKIGLVVVGLLSAVACGDSGDGDNGDTAGTNTGGGSAGANATNSTGDSAGTNGDSAGANGSTGSGTNGSTGSTSSNGTTSTNTSAGDDDGGTTGTGGEGACTNDADVAAFEAISDPGNVAQTCAIGALTPGGTPIKECYDKDPGFSKLSAGCRDCWSGVTQCVNDNCAMFPSGACITDMDSATVGPCEKCREEKCDGPFATCSGIDTMM